MFPPITIFVSGLPAGQPRVKAARRGGFTTVYTPKKVKTKAGYKMHPAEVWRQQIAAEVKRSWPVIPKIESPVSLSLAFYFVRPKSHYTKKGLRGSSPVYHVSKPDVDNAAKLIQDCFTSLGLWGDDAQVCRLWVGKYWTNNLVGGCEITIKEAQ